MQKDNLIIDLTKGVKAMTDALNEYVPNFVIVNNPYITKRYIARTDTGIEFMVYLPLENRIVNVTINGEITEDIAQTLVKQHNQHFILHINPDITVSDGIYQYNLDILNEHRIVQEVTKEQLMETDVRYIVLHITGTDNSFIRHRLAYMLLKYLTKGLIVDHHNDGTLINALSVLTTVSLDIEQLITNKRYEMVVTYSLHKEQPVVSENHKVIDLDNSRILPKKIKLVNGKTVEDDTPDKDTTDVASALLTKTYTPKV